MSKEEQNIEIVINKDDSTPNEKNDEPSGKSGNRKNSKSCKNIVNAMLKSRSRGYITDENTPTPSSESTRLKIQTQDIHDNDNSDLWTTETVQHLLDFADICHNSSLKCKQSSIKHKKVSQFFTISIILFGSLTATTSIGTIDIETKSIISTVCGVCTAIASSIQGFLKYAEKSETEANSCLELERMARAIRLELSKSKEFRVDPYKFIIKLENQREKILKSIGIEDE